MSGCLVNIVICYNILYRRIIYLFGGNLAFFYWALYISFCEAFLSEGVLIKKVTEKEKLIWKILLIFIFLSWAFFPHSPYSRQCVFFLCYSVNEKFSHQWIKTTCPSVFQFLIGFFLKRSSSLYKPFFNWRNKISHSV